MDPNIAIFLVGLLIGLVKGGLGGPIAGALILPLLSQTMSVPQAVGITLPLLMIGDAFALRFYWRTWDLRQVRLLLPAAIIGILMGTLLLVSLPDDVLRRLLGVFTLVVLIYKFVNDSLRQVTYQPQNWHGYLAGWGSGFASALANTGGPPVTAYLLLQRLEPVAFIGTITLFFATVNVLKVPGYLTASLIDGQTLLSILWVVPVIPFGVWFGRKAIGWFNRVWFERVMMVLLGYAALLLLFG